MDKNYDEWTVTPKTIRETLIAQRAYLEGARHGVKAFRPFATFWSKTYEKKAESLYPFPQKKELLPNQLLADNVLWECLGYSKWRRVGFIGEHLFPLCISNETWALALEVEKRVEDARLEPKPQHIFNYK